MILQFSNNAATTLAGSMSTIQTSLNVAAGSGVEFPTPVVGTNYFVITLWDQLTQTQNEIMWVTQKVGDTFTVQRAQEGSVARTWSAGDLINHELTAGQMGAFLQQGQQTSIAASSLIYSGTDTGSVNIVVVPSLTPSMGSLVFGMTFDILIASTNTGAATMSVMGLPSYPIVRIDGTPLVSGNLTGGQMMKMWWDGVKFVAPIQNIPVVIPNTTFYCNPAGDDNNDGLTPTHPCRTLQGCMNNVCSRYTSQQTITISCAHGTYTGGCQPPGPFVCHWEIRGDDASPGSCTIDARSSDSIANGCCIAASGGVEVNCHGFTHLSHQENCHASNGATIDDSNCIHTPPTSGNNHCIRAEQGGTIKCSGQHIYNGSTSCPSHFHAETGGCISLGYKDNISNIPCSIVYQGAPNFTTGCAHSANNGNITCVATNVSFTSGNLVTGPRHRCEYGGGIGGTGNNTNFFPGTLAGTVDGPSYGWFN